LIVSEETESVDLLRATTSTTQPGSNTSGIPELLKGKKKADLE
jgi:hypothetical protein